MHVWVVVWLFLFRRGRAAQEMALGIRWARAKGAYVSQDPRLAIWVVNL